MSSLVVRREGTPNHQAQTGCYWQVARMTETTVHVAGQPAQRAPKDLAASAPFAMLP